MKIDYSDIVSEDKPKTLWKRILKIRNEKSI